MTLQRNHVSDLTAMFCLPSHCNVLSGYGNFLDEIDLNFADDEHFPIEREQVPYLFDLLELSDLKVQVVLMPFHQTTLLDFFMNNKFSISQTIKILLDISQGLRHLVENDLVHCDVKMDNLLVDHDGNIVIIDFGMCTNLGSPATGGTPCNSPPEFLSVPVSSRTDVFAIGCIAYELFSDQHPFDNESVNFKWKEIGKNERKVFPLRKEVSSRQYKTDNLIFPQSFPVEISLLIKDMLSPDMDTRIDIFQCVEMLEEMNNYLRSQLIEINIPIQQDDAIIIHAVPDDEISFIQFSISKLTGAPIESQTLTISGEVLNGRSTLRQCGVTSATTLNLAIQ